MRLMVDLPNESDIVAIFIHKPGRKLLVASSAGDGFIVPEDEVVAQTRSGKQVLNGDALLVRRIEGDHLAVDDRLLHRQRGERIGQVAVAMRAVEPDVAFQHVAVGGDDAGAGGPDLISGLSLALGRERQADLFGQFQDEGVRHLPTSLTAV